MSNVTDKTARACLPFLAIAFFVVLFQEEAAASFEVQRILVGDIPDGTPGLGGVLRPRRDEYLGDYGTSSIEPLYLFEGKWLYSNGMSGGVHIVDNDWFFFDLNARFRLTKLDQDDVNRRGEGLETRDSTVEAGFATGLRTPVGDLRVEWGHDVLDRHDGASLELTYRYTFE
ncbi:MAG: MipA/OmpV family protein, partial [Gammaproteobacteria bacterium]|nr:MipA/OmpV family protein [Gammaproteobacteria bacterium]